MTRAHTPARIIEELEASTRFRLDQAALEGAALRGELGKRAQILALSEVYKRLRAAGQLDEAAAVKAEAYAIYEAMQQQEETMDDTPLPTTDLSIPPVETILALIKERYDLARLHDDTPGARQLDRVRQNLLNGARLAWNLGDLLIQSINTPGAVYSVNARGCTCPNGAAGKTSCWHVALYDLLIELAEEDAATADMEAERAQEASERAAAAMGRRLALARAQMLKEARAVVAA